jgi:hypothetical protein
MFANEETFFRVTEEDADGLFPTNDGGSILTFEERDGRYDFRLQFANSVWSKEAKKENALARYQLDLQNPLIAQNPIALWETTKAAHEALGDPNFEDTVPRPPQPDLPVDPKEEWVNLLHGEEIHVNPLDNDQLHLIRHMADMKKAEADPEHADPDALNKLVVHYHEQIAQLMQKRMQQALLESAAASAAKLMQPGGALTMPNGLFGNPPSQPPGNPMAQGPFLYSGHPENLHGQS